MIGMSGAAPAAPSDHRAKAGKSALLVLVGLRVEGVVDESREVVVGGESALVAVHEFGDLILQRLGLFFLFGGLLPGTGLRRVRGLVVFGLAAAEHVDLFLCHLR